MQGAVAGFVVQLLTGTYVVVTPKQEAKVRRKSFEEAHPDASLDLLDLTIRPMYESPTTRAEADGSVSIGSNLPR